MKSRLAILLMLVLGLTMSSAGAGLAIDGFTSNQASVAQYGPDKDDGGGDVLGDDDSASPGDVAGEDESGSPLQPARQVEAGATGGDTLPFTGFLAIPVLIGGVALLSAGLILRRRSADDRS